MQPQVTTKAPASSLCTPQGRHGDADRTGHPAGVGRI